MTSQSSSFDAPRSDHSLRDARRLAALFLALSFAISLVFLACRNIYDDEITSTTSLTLSTGEIVRITNHVDVHPPGMYVLGHWAYLLLPSARWITLFPISCLYVGLAVFVLAGTPLLRERTTLVCFLLLATLHPQLIMWANSIRWYPWWSGLALITLVVALQFSANNERLSFARASAIGVLIGALFYINYITILFGAALAVTLIYRYGPTVRRQLAATAAVSLLLISPQLHAFFTVHLRGSSSQRTNPVFAAARLMQGLVPSEAYLPWHPLAIASLLVFLVLTVAGLLASVRYLRQLKLPRQTQNGTASLVIFALLFTALIALSGLGLKPRNALMAVPLLAFAAALAFATLPLRIRYLLLGFLVLWSGVGIAHLLRREGVAKAAMNNRPEEVQQLISNTRGDGCSVVLTYDPALTFYVAQSHVPRQQLLTLSQNPIYESVVPFSAIQCPFITLYVVQSYIGGVSRDPKPLDQALATARNFIGGPVRIDHLNPDPDAPMKRRLHFIAGATLLPDDRYVVFSGRISPQELDALREAEPLFAIADGHSEPREQIQHASQPESQN